MKLVVAIFSLAILFPFLIGCGQSRRSSVRVILAIDVSDQTSDRLLTYASLAYRFQSQLEDQDEVEVFTFAHETDMVYQGHPIFDRNQFNEAIGSTFSTTHPGFHTPGTKADQMLQRVAKDCDASKQPLMLVIFTDGGVEDLSRSACGRISKAVESASRSTCLRHVVVAGVDQQWRDQWITWLRPLARRSEVRGPNDADQTLAECLDRFQQENYK